MGLRVRLGGVLQRLTVPFPDEDGSPKAATQGLGGYNRNVIGP